MVFISLIDNFNLNLISFNNVIEVHTYVCSLQLFNFGGT